MPGRPKHRAERLKAGQSRRWLQWGHPGGYVFEVVSVADGKCRYQPFADERLWQAPTDWVASHSAPVTKRWWDAHTADLRAKRRAEEEKLFGPSA